MTDYDHPIDWADYSDEEKHDWYCRERAARQFLRQSGVSSGRIRDGDTFELASQMLQARSWQRANGLK